MSGGLTANSALTQYIRNVQRRQYLAYLSFKCAHLYGSCRCCWQASRVSFDEWSWYHGRGAAIANVSTALNRSSSAAEAGKHAPINSGFEMPGPGREFQIRLYRDSLSSPWGFRLHGGKDLKAPLTVQKVGSFFKVIVGCLL